MCIAAAQCVTPDNCCPGLDAAHRAGAHVRRAHRDALLFRTRLGRRHRCARRDGAWFQAGWVRLPPPLPMFAGLGTLVAAHGEVRFVWRGVLAMTASQFTEASKLVPTCVDMESHRVSQPCRVCGAHVPASCAPNVPEAEAQGSLPRRATTARARAPYACWPRAHRTRRVPWQRGTPGIYIYIYGAHSSVTPQVRMHVYAAMSTIYMYHTH